MVCFSSSLGVLIVYVKKKLRKNESLVEVFKKIKVRKLSSFSPSLFLFCWFELGLKLALIFFGLGWNCPLIRTKNCVKRHVDILGEVLSKFP